MEIDPAHFSHSPQHRADLRPTSERGFYLSPPPLLIKAPKLPATAFPGVTPNGANAYSVFSPPAFFPMLGFSHREPTQTRKHFKTEYKDEQDDQNDKKASETTVWSPIGTLSPKSGMIELNRCNSDTIQVKQEPISPTPIWPTSPYLLHPPYLPPLHHNLLPYPYYLPGTFMRLSPSTFYQREDVRPAPKTRELVPSRNVPATTNPEKLTINVHVDESYYVDVGGDQKRWKCRMCDKSYTSKYNLVTHILGHNGIKPHGCHLCGKLFKQLSHLHTHLLTHQGMRPHKCKVCHKAFTQTSHLKRHMMQHSDVKPYSCSVCARGFAYPSELRAHELKHEKGQENICVECGLDFPTLAQLKRHLTVHRGPTLYRCSECQKTFQYPSQLQNHMMKHRDIRPYICTECGMEFIQSHHLKQHTLTHKGVKEHKCRICGREFTLLANMKRHVLIHTNVRAYQCHMCFKSFVQKQTLKAHMIVHSDIKPYKCKLCGKEFNRMHNLMGHMHLHSDSKPFKCLYCASKFTLKGNLTRHMKVKHGIMDRGLDQRLFRQRGRFCLPASVSLISHFSQEEPFDLSQKPTSDPGLRLTQSDGESIPGSSGQEEDEDSLYRRSQYSPEEAQNEPTEEERGQKDEGQQFNESDFVEPEETSGICRQTYDHEFTVNSELTRMSEGERNQNGSEKAESNYNSVKVEVAGRQNEEEDEE
ncbi:zinc finger protein 366 [Periophthalmus magnuspinnatus]|uniref:zinc finger protein 366 n=1 Tax=Periophthalmus magnuspinnatus TaxID=409849 RepID=UPI00145B7499|nr:zinc finger protein 366 [Periophthalmus magnuspinnatus]XP_055080243.1 zinc finger protein 366 [Periophthalmus magnuspinnatus]